MHRSQERKKNTLNRLKAEEAVEKVKESDTQITRKEEEHTEPTEGRGSS